LYRKAETWIYFLTPAFDKVIATAALKAANKEKIAHIWFDLL